MNTKQMTLKEGESQSIELTWQATSGYQWHIDEYNQQVVSVQLQHSKAPTSLSNVPIGGATSIEVIVTAVGKGTTQIKLSEIRPWAKSSKPNNKMTINVVVE